MNDSIFHGGSEGLALHEYKMKGYSQAFLPKGSEVLRILARVFQPPHVTVLFVLPGQAYSIVHNYHKYSTSTVYL